MYVGFPPTGKQCNDAMKDALHTNLYRVVKKSLKLVIGLT